VVDRQSTQDKDAEDRAKKAGLAADKEAEANKRATIRLKMQEEALKRESEKRLAAMLGEQRRSFEQTLKMVRTEADQKLKGFSDRIRELESMLKQAQEELREQFVKVDGAPQAARKAPGGGAVSAELMRAVRTLL